MAWEDNAAESGSTTGTEEGFEALPDLGQRLGLNPKSFRAILQQYSDLLPLRERGAEKGLAGSSIDYLEQIHRRTLEGYTEEEIRAELTEDSHDEPDRAEQPAAAVQDDEEAPSRPSGDEVPEVLEELRELRRQLNEFEQKRVRDRDKLMMSLMRTQKEMQQLRYEISSTRKRRHRTLWDRLLGR